MNRTRKTGAAPWAWIWTAALAVASLLATSSAFAAPHAIVLWTEGPDAAGMRAQAASQLGADYTVVEPKEWLAAMAKDGQKPPFAPSMRDAKKRTKLLARARKAARAVGAEDVVVITVTKRRPDAANVLVIDVADTQSETLWPLAGQDALAHAAAGELAKVHPAAAGDKPEAPAPVVVAPPPAPPPEPDAPPPPPPVADAPKKDGPAATTPTPRHVVGSDYIDVSAGIEVGHRHFHYVDGITANLRSYNLAVAPLFSIAGAVHPFADARSPVLSGIGVFGGYARAFALSSSSNGASVDTSFSRFDVGAGLRLRAGASPKAPLIGLSGAYGQESFTLSSSDATADLPSVSYRFVRPALDLRIPLGRAALFAAFGYRVMLGSGDVADRFTKTSIGGIDAELGGAIAVATGLEIRLEASYRRYFYTMHPVPGDAFVAGGALDEIMGLNASVAYVY